VSAVFTVLLAAADPVFERAVRWALSWDAEFIVSHSLVSAVIAWGACGYLLGLRPRAADAAVPSPEKPAPRTGLGLVEVGIPLGVLAALFGLFVGIQTRYFFGGDAVVLSTAGLGWGDYARRGFVELVAVTGLVLPLLLGADGLLDRTDRRTVRGFRTLSFLLLGLVALIAGSAVYRLWLYYGVYGLTPTRLYAAALMVWIVLVLAWFAATVLRDRRGAFPLGALLSGLGVLACLNAVNPDGLVAGVNLERAAAGAPLDLELLTGLSADAVPALARSAGRLPAASRCAIARSAGSKWAGRATGDWRTWNAGRTRARAVGEELSSLCREGET
jgi:hypothetical protein